MEKSSVQLDLSSLHDVKIGGRALDLDQYAGLWAIDEPRGQQLWQQVQRLNLNAHVTLHADDSIDRVAVQSVDTNQSERGSKIIIISVEGVMTKRGSSLSSSGSTIRARHELRKAGNDPDCIGVLMRFDTPGGTTAGTHDLASDIRKVNEKKPVYGFAEDLCASAGYYAISQCERIYANEPSSLIGSIGTYMAVYDISAEDAMMGRKLVLVKSSELKGTGTPGSQITEEQVAYLQELVDNHQEEFNRVVAEGRNRPLKTVADQWALGRVWPASQAHKMGLIDGIQSLDQTLHDLATAGQKGHRSSRKSSISAGTAFVQTTSQSENETPLMDANSNEKTPLTMNAIQEECAGFDSSSGDDALFATDCLSKDMTIEEVRKNWMETLRMRIESSEEARKAAEEKTAQSSDTTDGKPAGKSVGVDPLTANSSSGTSGSGDPRSDFWSLVNEKQQKGMPRQAAVSRTVAENPELHREMLEQHNGEHNRTVQLNF